MNSDIIHFAPIIETGHYEVIEWLSNRASVLTSKWEYDDAFEESRTFLKIIPINITLFNPYDDLPKERIELTSIYSDIKVFYTEKNVLFAITWYYKAPKLIYGSLKTREGYNRFITNSEKFFGGVDAKISADRFEVKQAFKLILKTGLNRFSIV